MSSRAEGCCAWDGSRALVRRRRNDAARIWAIHPVNQPHVGRDDPTVAASWTSIVGLTQPHTGSWRARRRQSTEVGRHMIHKFAPKAVVLVIGATVASYAFGDVVGDVDPGRGGEYSAPLTAGDQRTESGRPCAGDKVRARRSADGSVRVVVKVDTRRPDRPVLCAQASGRGALSMTLDGPATRNVEGVQVVRVRALPQNCDQAWSVTATGARSEITLTVPAAAVCP